LFALAGRRVLGATFRGFGNGKAGQAKGATGRRGAREIARNELTLGPMLHAPDGGDHDLHRLSPVLTPSGQELDVRILPFPDARVQRASLPKSAAHIFSML